MLDLADDWLMLERLGLIVWVGNDRAIGLYEASGFAIEGTMRRFVRVRGTLVDAHVMGRLRGAGRS